MGYSRGGGGVTDPGSRVVAVSAMCLVGLFAYLLAMAISEGDVGYLVGLAAILLFGWLPMVEAVGIARAYWKLEEQGTLTWDERYKTPWLKLLRAWDGPVVYRMLKELLVGQAARAEEEREQYLRQWTRRLSPGFTQQHARELSARAAQLTQAMEARLSDLVDGLGPPPFRWTPRFRPLASPVIVGWGVVRNRLG